jgi:N-acetylmuramoyl-L-alanine amidase
MKARIVGAFLFFLLLIVTNPTASFAEKVLVIDPGHGGKFTGTCGYSGNKTGFCEKHANLAVALKLKELLKNSGIKVYLTRETDKDFAPYLSNAGGDLEKRMAIANGYAKGNNDNSIFISIHHNAHPRSPYVKGLETYYYDGVHHYKPDWPHHPLQIKYLPDNKRLAEEAHSRLLKKLQVIDRGIHSDQSFYVIRNAQMPAILVELGYMTNKEEEARIKTSQYQWNAAKALAEAVKNYFKVFEVYNSKGERLALFKTSTEAINFAKKQTELVRVFDKDKQIYIYTNARYEVYHKKNGYISSYIREQEAIQRASLTKDTRVYDKEKGWTIWSNYLQKEYEVFENDTLVNSFYEFAAALEYVKNKSNVKIVKKSTNDILWSNIDGVAVTKARNVKKLIGAYRITTSTAISKEMYPNGFPKDKPEKVVILATGYDSADALSAGPLSRVYGNAPILLSDDSALDANVKRELLRLGAKKVVIIGGTKAISSNVEREIKSLKIEVERISGNNRFDTNRKILSKLGNVEGLFVASGHSYPDALGAAPIAAFKNWGIVLTDKDRISSSSLSIMANKPVIIVGGSAVVSDKVVSTIKSNGRATKVERLAGSDRFSTLARVLWYFEDELQTSTIHISTGLNFPDALAAAPLSIEKQAPLILVGKEMNRDVESFLLKFGQTQNIQEIKVIGGGVKDSLVQEIGDIVR